MPMRWTDRYVPISVSVRAKAPESSYELTSACSAPSKR